ncbi:hypothetical protein B1992_05520 [Pseudoxanthomonas broegbernensis]|uniref:Uncharacterized protein n=1 Tax=Pseudoxanthomonas broegbernensis TaxID=83619 RepID=A0A7V8K7Q1_9GAMM|nr:copper resistance protein NlpE [Pseudoxanthomonas broegbernensis]KAF1686853.1 hypothetical protein B1992_05520 [Pseudoxanthomonas broegbernensis]MBB6065559.1 hypothetical protein [Pseudoxanthomonas broegbernensis]
MKRNPSAATALLFAAGMAATIPAMAVDACLVGTWSPEGNGAAEWVQRQSPGMKVLVQQEVATLRLNADGSYSAQARMRMEGRAAQVAARSGGSFSAQGGWSASGDRLTLVPSASRLDGTVDVSAGKAGTRGHRLPSKAARPTAYQYACGTGTLETRMRIPGVSDPIVQRYRRQ